MKTSHTCAKCRSNRIVHVPGQIGAFGAGNNIFAGRTVFSAVPVARYVCATCGFCEDWVDSAEDLARLVKRWGVSAGPPDE